MPLLDYSGGLPVFWDMVHSLYNAMRNITLCLTAFLATGTVFRETPFTAQVTSGNYLLGLGKRPLSPALTYLHLKHHLLQGLPTLQGNLVIFFILQKYSWFNRPVVETNMVSRASP
jgi:hypothetical protein